MASFASESSPLIARLAADRRVHQAFQWLHLQEQRILQWQTELVGIPAPPFGEGPRAEWLCARFRELELEDVRIDEIGNVLATRRGAGPASSERRVLLSAHIDTIFPGGTPIEPVVRGSRLSSPGACDNGAGVAAMLAIAATMRHAGITPALDMEFAGNVGEEGEGDLRGMRHLYREGANGVEAHVVLDGAGDSSAVTQALGSQRWRVTVRGPGGHAWTDAGRPNPIAVLSRAIQRFSETALPDAPRTTANVGTIAGGTAINAIPEEATASFDLRSTDREQLIRLEVELHRAVEDAVLGAARGQRPDAIGLRWNVEKIGDRPAGKLAADGKLLEILRAVDRHLGIRTDLRVASTDANIPLSLGVPAVSLGAGGTAGGIHTYAEWYDGRGRESALRRILLLLLALADA
jgi:tripeptide aminopeptidase